MSELTPESIKALLADELGRRAEEDKQARYKEYIDFTKDLKSSIDSTLNGFTARIDKEVTAKIGNIASGFEELKQFQTELKTALEAPDDDSTPSTSNQAVQPTPSIDLDKMLEEKTKQIEESFKKTYGSKIKALEDTVEAKEREATEIRKAQIEAERDSGFMNTLKKVSAQVNLHDDHEDLAFEYLQKKAKMLQPSEDGKSWLIKTKQKNRFTGQDEEVLLEPNEDTLKAVLAENCKMYIKPYTNGFGSNATPTQPYRQQPNRSAAELLDTVNSSNGDLDLDAIAAAISAS